jgi:hypothetical protein
MFLKTGEVPEGVDMEVLQQPISAPGEKLEKTAEINEKLVRQVER